MDSQLAVVVLRFGPADTRRWSVPTGGLLAAPIAVTDGDPQPERVVNVLMTDW